MHKGDIKSSIMRKVLMHRDSANPHTTHVPASRTLHLQSPESLNKACHLRYAAAASFDTCIRIWPDQAACLQLTLLVQFDVVTYCRLCSVFVRLDCPKDSFCDICKAAV